MPNSADAIIAVKVEKEAETALIKSRSLELTKSRSRDTGWAAAYDLESACLGKDDDGDAVYSAFVVPVSEAGEEPRKPDPWAGDANQLVKNCIVDALQSDGDYGLPPGYVGEALINYVPLGCVKDLFIKRCGKTGDAARMAWSRGLKKVKVTDLICDYGTNVAFARDCDHSLAAILKYQSVGVKYLQRPN